MGNKNSHPSPRRNVGELRGGRSGFPPEADYSGAAASEFNRLAFPLGLGLPLGTSGSHIQFCVYAKNILCIDLFVKKSYDSEVGLFEN